MKRYFITTSSDHCQACDHEGLELSDIDALADMLRKTLSLMVHKETGETEFWVKARDSAGQLVMSARATIVAGR